MPLKGEVTYRSAHNFKLLPVGFRRGRLTVIAYAGSRLNSSGKRKGWYNCRCDCGATKQIRATHLRQGSVKSCGCLRQFLGRTRMQAAHELLRVCLDKNDI